MSLVSTESTTPSHSNGVNSHSGSSRIESLEAKAESVRDRIEDTIDDLKSATSTGQIVDQMLSAVDGGPTQYLKGLSKGLGRTVRDNPLPVAMLAVGAIWLASSAADSDDDLDDDALDPQIRPRYAQVGEDPGYVENTSTTTVYTASSAAGVREDSSHGNSSHSEGDGLIHRAQTGLTNAKERVGDLRASMSDTLSDKAEHVGELAQHAASAVGERAESLRGSADETARRTRRSARRAGRSAKSQFQRQLDENPMVLAAIGIALGAAAGGMLPSTRTEDELMGERSDALANRVRQSVEPRVEQVTRRAEQLKHDLAAQGLSRAEDAKQGLTAQARAAADMVTDKLHDAADRLHREIDAREPDTDAGAEPGTVGPESSIG